MDRIKEHMHKSQVIAPTGLTNAEQAAYPNLRFGYHSPSNTLKYLYRSNLPEATAAAVFDTIAKNSNPGIVASTASEALRFVVEVPAKSVVDASKKVAAAGKVVTDTISNAGSALPGIATSLGFALKIVPLVLVGGLAYLIFAKPEFLKSLVKK
jgi:hypothetical protein